jgi:hypothetical protein
MERFYRESKAAHPEGMQIEPRDEAIFALRGAMQLMRYDDPLATSFPRTLHPDEENIISSVENSFRKIDFDSGENLFRHETWIDPLTNKPYEFEDGVRVDGLFDYYETAIRPEDEVDDDTSVKRIMWGNFIAILREHSLPYVDLFSSDEDLAARIRMEAEVIALNQGIEQVDEAIISEATERITNAVLFYPDSYRQSEQERRRKEMLAMMPEIKSDGVIPRTIFEKWNPFTKQGLGATLITAPPAVAAIELGADRSDVFMVSAGASAVMTAGARMASRKNTGKDESRLGEIKSKVGDVTRASILPVAATYGVTAVDVEKNLDAVPSERLVDLIRFGGVVAYGFVLPRALKMVRGPVIAKLGAVLEKRGKALFPDYKPFVIDPNVSPIRNGSRVSQDTWDLLMDLHPVMIGMHPAVRDLFHGDQSYLDTIDNLIKEILKSRTAMQYAASDEDQAFLQYMSLYNGLVYIKTYEDQYTKKRTLTRLEKAKDGMLDAMRILDPLVINAIEKYHPAEHYIPTGDAEFDEQREDGMATFSLIPQLQDAGMIEAITKSIYDTCKGEFTYDEIIDELKSLSFRDNVARGVARLFGLKAGGLASYALEEPRRLRKKASVIVQKKKKSS